MIYAGAECPFGAMRQSRCLWLSAVHFIELGRPDANPIPPDSRKGQGRWRGVAVLRMHRRNHEHAEASAVRSDENTSELQSVLRNSYAAFSSNKQRSQIPIPRSHSYHN